jgi:hypothetical protein
MPALAMLPEIQNHAKENGTFGEISTATFI